MLIALIEQEWEKIFLWNIYLWKLLSLFGYVQTEILREKIQIFKCLLLYQSLSTNVKRNMTKKLNAEHVHNKTDAESIFR